MINLAEKYRLKALACENLGRAAKDAVIQFAWAEIAIEWHALSYRISQHHEIEVEASRSV